MALIITRNEGEAFYIGDDIKVTILDNAGHTKIAIDAPKEKIILRQELCSTEDFRNKESTITANK